MYLIQALLLSKTRFYFTDDGISIPCKYTSYVAPMMSMKLHTEAGLCREPGKLSEVSAS